MSSFWRAIQLCPSFGVLCGLAACSLSQQPSAAPPDPSSASAAPVEMSDARVDPAVRDPGLPACSTDEGWDVAPGFTTSQPVDYIAARWNGCKAAEGCPTQVMSEVGEPCATARDRAACERALARPGMHFHLATTQGDTVRKWHREQMTEILGPVDTLAEAIWAAKSMGFAVQCNVALTKETSSILIEGVVVPFSNFVTTVALRVSEDGTVETVSSDPPLATASIGCPAIGCSDGVVLASDLAVSLDELRATTLRVCENAECSSVSMSQMHGTPSSREDAFLDSVDVGATLARVTLGTQDDEHPWIQVAFGPDSDRLVPGDVYSARVTGATGRELMELQQTVGERPPPPPQSQSNRCPPLDCITLRIDTRADPDPWSL